MTAPWYKDGLRFTCTRCGNCCTGEPGFVWVTDDELSAIADHLGESLHEVKLLYTRLAARGRTLREKRNSDCVFYEKGAGCTIYPVRPAQCRTWPFWESNVVSGGTLGADVCVCPGAGQGELIPEEEITRRLQVIRL